MQIKNSKYYIYIILCENNVLYTGVTTDYKRRFMEHSGESGDKKGAKFTKSHIPIKIVALWKTDNRSNAQKLESRIKKLSHDEKEELINDRKYFKKVFNDELEISIYRRITC